MNKKILTIVISFFIFFIFGRVNAQEVAYPSSYIFDNYEVNITINKNNTITVEEKIKTGDLNYNYQFSKSFRNYVSSLESDFLELPNNSQIIDADDFNVKYFDIELKKNDTYYLKYTIDITHNKNDYMDFIYSPLLSKTSSTTYKKFIYTINNANNYVQESFNNRTSKQNFNVNIENNTIKGIASDYTIPYSDNSIQISIIFFNIQLQPTIFEINLFGVKTNILFLTISIIMFIIVAMISIKKITTKDTSLDKLLIYSSVIYTIITFFLMSFYKNQFNLPIFIFVFILSLFYAAFFKSSVFSKVKNSILVNIILSVHCYLMVCGVTRVGGIHSFINIYLILLLLSLLIVSTAYRCDQKVVSNEKAYTPDELMVVCEKKIPFFDSKPYDSFEKYKKNYLNNIRFDLFQKILVHFSISISLLFTAISLLQFKYPLLLNNTIYVVLSLIIGCILFYIIVIRGIIKYKNNKKLIEHGRIINDLPFEYVNVKLDYQANENSKYYVINYKIKVNYNCGEKQIFISKKKKEFYLYNNRTCSLIVLDENPEIFYIDFDIPNR